MEYDNQVVIDAPITITDSGLQYYEFKYSDGAPVRAGQIVTMHYMIALNLDTIEEGPWLENSWRNEPISFRLGTGEVLRGIDEGVQGMRIASQRRIIIPPQLAFGKRGVPGRVLPNTTLYLEVYVVTAENAL